MAEINKNFKIKCLKTGGTVNGRTSKGFGIRIEPFIREELNEMVQVYPDASLNSIINIAIHEMYKRNKKIIEKKNKK